MNNDNSLEFSISVTADAAKELEDEILASLKEQGLDVSSGSLAEFDGPPTGAFGFSEGLLKFANQVWSDIAKVPGAIEAVAKGIAGYMTKNRLDITFEKSPDGNVVMRTKASGRNINEAAIAEQIAKVLKSV